MKMWGRIITYAIGGLLVIGTVYGVFIFSPKEPAKTPLATVSQPLAQECPICSECPVCEKCEETSNEKIVYRDNPEQQKTIETLQNQVKAYQSAVETCRGMIGQSFQECEKILKSLDTEFSKILNKQSESCKNYLLDLYLVCDRTLDKYDSTIAQYKAAFDIVKSSCASIYIPYVPPVSIPQVPMPHSNPPVHCHVEYLGNTASVTCQ